MDGSDSVAPQAPIGRKSRSAATIAEQIVGGATDRALGSYVKELAAESSSTATQAARVVDEVIERSPNLGEPFIAKLVEQLGSPHARVVLACARALPRLGSTAPAKVARRIPALRARFESDDPVARDAVVHTFAALCGASVAYQKRLLDVFQRALVEADPQTLARWTPMLLPRLKGEPYAQARETVEGRLHGLPDTEAQEIAAFLGVRLPSRAHA